MVRETLVIVCLLFAAGCTSRSAGAPSAEAMFDAAIENLSRTTQQLESISREKDFFVKVLNDFEEQGAQYTALLGHEQITEQMEELEAWHADITERERLIAAEHAVNVFAAHNQVARRDLFDPNRVVLASPANGQP